MKLFINPRPVLVLILHFGIRRLDRKEGRLSLAEEAFGLVALVPGFVPCADYFIAGYLRLRPRPLRHRGALLSLLLDLSCVQRLEASLGGLGLVLVLSLGCLRVGLGWLLWRLEQGLGLGSGLGRVDGGRVLKRLRLVMRVHVILLLFIPAPELGREVVPDELGLQRADLRLVRC